MDADTKTPAAPETKAKAKAPAPAVTPPPLPANQPEPAVWYFGFRNKTVGPFTLAQMHQKLASRQITKDSLVWQAGMEAWVKMSDAFDFSMAAGAAPPALPQQSEEIDETMTSIVVDNNYVPLVENAFKIAQRGGIIRSKFAGDADPVWLVRHPHNINGTNCDPALKIRARTQDEAEMTYRRYLGITGSEHPFQVAAA